MTIPTALNVGQTAVAASFKITNTNTAPNGYELNSIPSVQIAPSCGTTATASNVCTSLDAGVFSVGNAMGLAKTSCAAMPFGVSALDAVGAVLLTPLMSVAIPPGSWCVVSFTVNVLKMPTIDTNAEVPGIQTRMNVQVTGVGVNSGLVVNTPMSVEVTVQNASPTLVTRASWNIPTGTVSATSTVTNGMGLPTGTMRFSLYGPNNAACTGAAIATSTNSVVNGVATSGALPVTTPGTYRFGVSYSGDPINQPLHDVCSAPDEVVVVTVRRPVADFDGNDRTDMSVYRPATGQWWLQSPFSVQAWGVPGDIPVPGDYDGNGTADKAVYRPSNGFWYILTPTPRFVVWGVTGDIPVPADYDGNGATDVAVYRPSTGQWFLESPFSVATWGMPGDVPVPGDYDGNGTADRAIYRPAIGLWYILTPTPRVVAWGTTGDIPVPADYDGNGAVDLAVFRRSTGQWFVQSPSSVVTWGQSGDVPVPGDYDGDGTMDRAVYRPSNGFWYILTPSARFVEWGAAGDIPLPLPNAIYRSFF